MNCVVTQTTNQHESMKTLTEIPEEVAAKLCKLLSLSKSGEAAEAEQAMARARRMAVEYQIDLASVDMENVDSLHDAKEEHVNDEFRTAKGFCRKPPSHKWISSILQEHFGVSIVSGIQSSRIWFVGRKSNVVFAKYAYTFLQRTFNKLWVKHKRLTDSPMSSRNSFFYGLYMGINARLTKEAVEAKQEALLKIENKTHREETDTRYQMVVVSETEALQQAVDGFHPVLRKTRASTDWGDLGDSLARSRGDEAGQTVTIAAPLAENRHKGEATREALK